MKTKKLFRLISLGVLFLSAALFFAACGGKNRIPKGTYVPHEETARAFFAETGEYADSAALDEQMEYFLESFSVRIKRDKFIYGTNQFVYELNSDGSVTFPGGEIDNDTFTYIDGKLIMSYQGLVVEMIKT